MKSESRSRLVLGILMPAWFQCLGIAAAAEIYRDPARPVDQRVGDLLGRMTLEEKIDQLSQKGADDITMNDGRADEASLERLFAGRSVGALCVRFGDDLFQSGRRLAAGQKYLRERTRLGIPALTVNEGLHGVLAQGATIYPQFLALGCTWNPALASAMGSQISREASAAGINQLLTPMVEVVRDPRWGRVEECIGESPFLVSRMCSAYTLGIQGDLRKKPLAHDKSLAMLKTFAGYSAPLNGINLANCVLGQRELRSTCFPPVEQVIRETGVLSVMPSYNEVDGIPSHANRWLLEDVLRGEMGFRGYTYSDWGGVEFNCGLHHVAADNAEAGAMALEAGVDLEAPGPTCYRHLAGAVKRGRIKESEIDKAAGRVLRVKFLAGLFDGRPDGDPAALKQIARCAEHLALSQRIAEESIVLLKNDKGLLPLDRAKLKSVAVIGPNADQVQFGDYCWSKNNRDGVTVLRGLRERLGDGVKVSYAKGCDLAGLSTAGFAAAVEAAARSDVAVVVLGDTSMILSGVGWEDRTLPASGTVGEGYDVTDPVPPGAQQDLVRAVLATGKPVVVVFLNGRPYSVPWMKEQVPAIVEAFYPGQRQGYAVADVLLGRVNPSGRLAMTVPQSAGHIPTVHDYKPSGRGYYHRPGTPTELGRDYVFSSPAPLWAFGFGLSYTTFSYEGLTVDTPSIPVGGDAKVSFTVGNTGARAGKEVAQVYLRELVSSVTTPVMRLAGFEKLELDPGQSRRVTLAIPASEMALWNVKMRRVVEPGDFDVMVGSSAEDVKLRGKFAVASGTARAEQTLWIAAQRAERLSPLMAKGSELHLCEDGALGDFLVPTIAADRTQPGDASFAEFRLDIPRKGTYYLWARLRCPSGQAESFAVSASTAKSGGAALVLGGSGMGVRQWHWDSHGEGAACVPGTGRLRLELPAGACTLRIQAHEAGASVFYPLRWRQAEPAFNPRLNALCLTSDPHYVPDDKAAELALAARPGVSAIPRVEAVSLPAISDSQWQASGKGRLPDWMRCPRWYTKDAWCEEIARRHPGDIAALVRQVAANGGSALRLSVYFGGCAYYQSRVTPHVSGLGRLDYLREAVDEGRSTGVKIVAYMNPNCLREGHPLFDACCVRDAGGRAVPCGPAYGSNAANSRYACINHPRYRHFLRDLLTEIFARYRPAGLYVDGLTPHVCCCEHCRAKYREMFGVEMPAAKLSRVAVAGVTWGEYGGDPEAVGDVENDLDCRRLTQMLYRSLVEVTHEFTATVKGCQAEAVTAYHSHPKPACAADYDATLTEVYSSRPWVHTAWRCGELAGFSNVFRVPVLFNVYPHEHYTAAEARYKAIQGLAAGAYPNFWSTPGMQPVFDFMRRNAEYLDFATTAPVKFLALPRDVRLDPTQAATPAADGVRYRDDRFLAPAVGAYAALTRSALPVLTLQRPHFHEHLAGFQVLCLANMTNMSDEQVQAVRRYVRSGGGLIASHETSLYDEKGRRRPDFALADVFGARYRRVLGAASRRVRFEPASPLAAGLAGLPPLEHAEPHVAVELTTGRCAARLTGPDLAPDVPAAIVHEFGKGRVVYLPGRLDALECYQLTPQVERLFANAVRWLVRGRLPIEVTSPGMVGVSCFRQPRRLLVHLVNHQRDSRLRDDAFQPLVRVGVRLQLPPGFEVARVHRLWTPSDVAYKCNGDCLLTELDTIGEYEVLAVELKPIIVHAVGNALFVVPPLGGVTADFRLKPVLRTSVVSSRVQ